jgi:hypothetical protein
MKTTKRVRFADDDVHNNKDKQHQGHRPPGSATQRRHRDIDEDKKQAATADTGDGTATVAYRVASTITTVSTTGTAAVADSPLLYIFSLSPNAKGTDMAPYYIESLRRHVEGRGVSSQSTFSRDRPPTHLIISDRLSNDNVVWEYLNFCSRDGFIDYLSLHSIVCA